MTGMTKMTGPQNNNKVCRLYLDLRRCDELKNVRKEHSQLV